MVTPRWGLLALFVALLGSTVRPVQAQSAEAKPEKPSPSAAAPTAPGAAPAAETAPEPSDKAPPAQPAEAEPRLHHGPVGSATAHEPLEISAGIEHPELVRRALLVYQTPRREGLKAVEFRRGTNEYVAQIPADDVAWPSVSYAIEIERIDGTRVAVFASRQHLHTVLVPEDLEDVRERALSERLGNRRSVFFATGEYVDFGPGVAQVQNLDGSSSQLNVHDSYYRIEGGYTYRPLRFVTEFSLRVGLVRGTSLVPRQLKPGEAPEDALKVGLNYGAPSVRIRVDDLVHLEGEFLTSVTEIGFSVGGGGAVLIGDPYGSKLTLGVESVWVFGTRYYSRLDIRAAPGVLFSPMVEATNMPHAHSYGVRLLGELAVDLGGGIGVGVRGGYQARLFTSGGPSFGATLSYSF